MTRPDEIAKDCVAVRTRILNRVVSGIYDEALSALNFKASQLNVLVVAAMHEKVRPAELCRLLRMDESTLSRNVERMRRKGWLALEPDRDRRTHWIRLTSKGSQLLERAYPAWAQAQREVMRRLGDEGQAALRVVLEKLLS